MLHDMLLCYSAVTVCDYHEAVEMYCGSSEDSLCCVRWLCRNLLVQQSVLLLHNLSYVHYLIRYVFQHYCKLCIVYYFLFKGNSTKICFHIIYV